MPRPTHKFAFVSPNTFDGDPFEVAERSLKQAEALVMLARQALDESQPMVLNAVMELAIQTNPDADLKKVIREWPEQGLAKKLSRVRDDLTSAQKALAVAAAAAAYNPKKAGS
jgi:hypothetical protein